MLAVIHQRSSKYITLLKLLIRNKFFSNVQLTEYYFGYGANLDTSRFAKNHMHALEIGVAHLVNHEIKFSLATEFKNKGYAGVHPNNKSFVPGVLVKIDPLSLSYLDKLEWCGFGAYNRVRKKVMLNEKLIETWVYEVKNPDLNRIPSSQYLKNMINSAIERKFPEGYIDFLRNQRHQGHFEIDHEFSLWTYSRSRKYVHTLKLFYKIHDKIRDKLCSLI